MVRNSLKDVLRKYQREEAAVLKFIHRSTTVEIAEQKLTDFQAKWDERYPLISQSWRKNWARVIPL
jgi:transposase-like protein